MTRQVRQQSLPNLRQEMGMLWLCRNSWRCQKLQKLSNTAISLAFQIDFLNVFTAHEVFSPFVISTIPTKAWKESVTNYQSACCFSANALTQTSAGDRGCIPGSPQYRSAWDTPFKSMIPSQWRLRKTFCPSLLI